MDFLFCLEQEFTFSALARLLGFADQFICFDLSNSGSFFHRLNLFAETKLIISDSGGTGDNQSNNQSNY